MIRRIELLPTVGIGFSVPEGTYQWCVQEGNRDTKAIISRLTDVGIACGNQRGIDKTTQQAMWVLRIACQFRITDAQSLNTDLQEVD